MSSDNICYLIKGTELELAGDSDEEDNVNSISKETKFVITEDFNDPVIGLMGMKPEDITFHASYIDIGYEYNYYHLTIKYFMGNIIIIGKDILNCSNEFVSILESCLEKQQQQMNHGGYNGELPFILFLKLKEEVINNVLIEFNELKERDDEEDKAKCKDLHEMVLKMGLEFNYEFNSLKIFYKHFEKLIIGSNLNDRISKRCDILIETFGPSIKHLNDEIQEYVNVVNTGIVSVKEEVPMKKQMADFKNKWQLFGFKIIALFLVNIFLKKKIKNQGILPKLVLYLLVRGIFGFLVYTFYDKMYKKPNRVTRPKKKTELLLFKKSKSH